MSCRRCDEKRGGERYSRRIYPHAMLGSLKAETDSQSPHEETEPGGSDPKLHSTCARSRVTDMQYSTEVRTSKRWKCACCCREFKNSFCRRDLAARRLPELVLYFSASKDSVTELTLLVRLLSTEHELRRYPMNALSLVPAPYATLLPCNPSAIATSFSASTTTLPALPLFTAIFSV